jgi:hypothetical protein
MKIKAQIVLIWLIIFLFPKTNKSQSLIFENDFKKAVGIPPEFQSDFRKVFSVYLELKNKNIRVEEKKIRTTMRCRPKIFSLFREKKNRRYLIIINNDSAVNKAILLKNIPQQAQIGVIAHELGHIIDYENKSNFVIFTDGIKYLFLDSRAKFEKHVDQIAIDKGFGEQLYQFIDFILKNKDIPEKYKDYKKRIYLSPEEIKKKMNYSGINFEK